MRKYTRPIVRLIFLAALLNFTTSASALVARAEAFLHFETNDNACNLHYTYWGQYLGEVLQYNAPEALLPILFRGSIRKGFLADVSSCLRSGIVASTPWFCSTSYSGWCPSVEGVYLGDSRLAITSSGIVTVYAGASGPAYANCWSCPPPPPPCDAPSSVPWQTTVIELVSGRELRLRDSPSERLIRSVRNDMDSVLRRVRALHSPVRRFEGNDRESSPRSKS
jgi:hypothetical protein